MTYVVCPFCYSMATTAPKDESIHECQNPDCRKGWEARHYMQLWNKYGMQDTKESKHHNGKVFDD